jgi:NAD(P)H dehydrogenase (quinone)
MDGLGGLWAQGKLANKAYAAYTSSQTAHGGQETTLIGLYVSLMHFGGILVPSGYTDALKFADGNPYGVSHITGPHNHNDLDDATLVALDHLATRWSMWPADWPDKRGGHRYGRDLIHG